MPNCNECQSGVVFDLSAFKSLKPHLFCCFENVSLLKIMELFAGLAKDMKMFYSMKKNNFSLKNTVIHSVKCKG